MAKTTSEQYARIIKRGKEWMKKSLDPQHDSRHASIVEKVSLDVYDELRKQNYPGIDDVNRELVIIAAWWHDCFKAIQRSFNGNNNMIEGRESAKIIKKELSNSLSGADLKKLLNAVRHHAGFSTFRYLFKPGSFSPLYKILMEADAYDAINTGRLKTACRSTTSISRKIWLFIDTIQSAILPIYLRTKTARKNLYSRLWNFWGTAYWKEGLLIKNVLGIHKSTSSKSDKSL